MHDAYIATSGRTHTLGAAIENRDTHERSPQVREELDYLEKALCELEHATGELLARIEPACCTRPVAALDRAANGEANPPMAPLAGKLRDLRFRVTRNISEIRNRLSELEL